MPKKLLIDLHFLPSLEYFVLLRQFDVVVLERHEHFVKQSYRNRCSILGANKVLDLVVPVKKGSQRTVMEKVEIDYHHIWLPSLWNSIQSAYGKSPFFEFYREDLYSILFSKPTFLFELNDRLLSFCLDCLQFDIKVEYSKRYSGEEMQDISDFRSHILPKKPFSQRNVYHPHPYQQIFGSKFVPDLSIIDLLFCEGPNSSEILKKSLSPELKQYP